jgi:molybdopterin-containing oxidoreductase family membrane subunit
MTVSETKFTWRIYLWMVFLLILVCIWAYGTFLIETVPRALFVHPTTVFSILLALYTFLAISATGVCIIASFSEVFGIENYARIARRGELLAIILLVVGLIAITIEGGRTDRTLNYFTFTNLSSNFALTIVFYACHLIFGLFTFWLILRRDIAVLSRRSIGLKRTGYLLLTLGVTDTSDESHERDMKLSRFTALGALLSDISACAVLGSIYGFVRAFPALLHPIIRLCFMPVYFILTAILLGASAICITVIGSHWARRRTIGKDIQGLMLEFRWFIAAFIVINILFHFAWEKIRHYTIILPASELFIIEVMIGFAIPLAILVVERTGRTMPGIFIASLLALIGGFAGKLDMSVGRHVVLTRPTYYLLTVPEVIFTIGTIGLCIFIYTIGEVVLPLEESE